MGGLVCRGNFNRSKKYLTVLPTIVAKISLDKYGQAGVEALRRATPYDTGKTSESWDYTITKEKGMVSIRFTNTNINNGVPIAIILQYGHGTRNGGYVQGRDYINPAVQPIFDKLANDAWGEVTRL